MDLRRGVPEPEELLRELGPAPSAPVIVSSVEPYITVIEDLLNANVEMATIHSRLVREHGYRGSCSSVKRLVRRLHPRTPEVCLRIETPPGREAQVDFGGVPEEIVIDNLKAAVLKADLQNPTLSVPYTRLARHYGFLVHPCRVRTPEHKGKVENGVRYVQRSFIAGREFVDIAEANRMLLKWVANEAGVREHGTTHEASRRAARLVSRRVSLKTDAQGYHPRSADPR